MAGATTSFAYEETHAIRKVIMDWLSDDATGAVSGTSKKVYGTLIKGVTDPGAAAPSDNYNITVKDENGLDVLAFSVDDLLLRDTANTEQVYFALEPDGDGNGMQGDGPTIANALTIAVTAAGNAKTGQVILYMRGA